MVALWLLAAGLLVFVVVFVLTGGHVIFLPLVFVPLGILSLLGRRRRRDPR
jgi:Flp pilus assembly protein TadB